MRKNLIQPFGCAVLVCLLMAGCSTTTRSISTDEDIHYDEAYDFSDKKKIVDALVDPLLTQNFPAPAGKPVIVVYDIANRTSEHIDTTGISDDIRTRLLKSGKFQFINATQRANIEMETSYQHGGAVTPADRIELGRQVGAQYMLSGTLRSIEKEEPRGIRLKKNTMNYYSLHLEMTNLKTSLIEWADSVDLAREASKPIIGW
jgi:hypothetical protein